MLGSLKNQGLSEATPVNHGATINNSGKLGKCYSFSGSSQYIDTGFKESISTGDFTISAWVKLTSDTTKTYQPIISNKTTAANSVGFAIYFNHNQNKFLWSTADGTNATEIWTTNTFADVYNTWTHVVMVRNSSDPKIGYFYINGERQDLASVPPVRNITNATYNMIIGDIATHNNAAYLWTGDICDVRIYDEAIPPKLAKELSKGLVLHYPLNRGGFGGDNLLKYSQISETNKQLLKTSISSSWNNLTITNIDGYDAYTYPSANSSTWFSSGKWFEPLSANTTYSYSAWIYFTASANTAFNFLSLGHFQVYNNASTKSDKAHEDIVSNRIYEPSIIPPNKWTKIRITFTTNELDGSYFVIYPRYAINPNVGTLYFRDMKLECGDSPTPWIPNSVDTLYSSMGLDDNIEYDVSGYQNNGTITGSLTCSSDTPRYMVSTYFNGGDNAITVPFNSVISDATIPFTINLWFKKSELGTDNYESLFGGPSGFEMDTRSGNATSLSLFMTSTRGGAVYSPFNLNEWYMVTMASDRTNEYYYVNGELSKTITAKSMPVGNYFIGAWQVYNKQNYKGLISDFRIYSTCLSADDILALYHTPVSIASNGTLMTQGELSEV